jgi:hypothetical protein
MSTPTDTPNSGQPAGTETGSPLPKTASPLSASSSDEKQPLIFKFWAQQHESLKIQKKGLPRISNDQASLLIRYLCRYEAALGIREALQEGIPMHIAKADRELLINLTALEEKTSYSNVEAKLWGAPTDDDLQGNPQPPCWDQDIALRFIQWVSRLDPFVIATFIYIHSCDGLAVGLITFNPDEQKSYISNLYDWALDCQPDLDDSDDP